MNIAIVEGDPLQRTTLESWLQNAGHTCQSFDNALDFSNQAQRNVYQVLLFDWELPVMIGIDLLSRLRTQLQDNTPVIIITSRNSEADIVHALQQGADDC